MTTPDFEGVLAAHELLSGHTATRHKRKFVGSFVCSCGDFKQEVENVPYQTLYARHAAAALNAEVARWLADEGTRDGCGGCKGQGSHRRHCPRHPSYHPWIPLADRAEDIGDSIGVPEFANRAWALAGAIRDGMADHPYHPVRLRSEETP